MPEQPTMLRRFHFVETDDAERLLRFGLAVLAAASVGEPARILLTARPLRRLAARTPGADRDRDPPLDPAILRALPDPWSALDEAAALAHVELLTCDTELALSGLADPPRGCALTSLPAFWREASGSPVCVW